MPTFHRLEDIRAWHLARKLSKEVYAISNANAFHKDGALRIQIRKAAVSVVSNISEGFARDGNREFLQFLSHSKGSAGEVIGQLYIALDQRYVDGQTFFRIRGMARHVMFMLDNLMRYLRETEMKGRKFVRVEANGDEAF